MTNCPSCSQTLDDSSTTCGACGHPVSAAPMPAIQAIDPPVGKADEPWNRRKMVAAGLIALAGVMAVVLAGRNREIASQGSAPPPSALPATGPAKKTQEPTILAAGVPSRVNNSPKWTRSRQSGWATDGSRTVTFELKAEREVPVWMRRVVPTLGLRCLGKQIEVFVVMDWPASVEDRPDKHTVTLSLDDASPESELWDAAQDNRTLFAPNGASFARRLVNAKTLQFGFKPYNAQPVSTEFDLTGIDKLAPQVAKTCGRSI